MSSAASQDRGLGRLRSRWRRRWGVVTDDQKILTTAIQVMMLGALAASWNILGGFAGQISLGHATFFGLGALITRELWLAGRNFALAVTVAVVATAIVAFIVGVPMLRFRDIYFSIGTLALGVAVFITIGNVRPGISSLPVEALREYTFTEPYYFTLLVLVATVVATVLLERSKLGLGMMAVRDDEEAAAATGVGPLTHKLSAFVISAALAALVGGFLRPVQRQLLPQLPVQRGLDLRGDPGRVHRRSRDDRRAPDRCSVLRDPAGHPALRHRGVPGDRLRTAVHKRRAVVARWVDRGRATSSRVGVAQRHSPNHGKRNRGTNRKGTVMRKRTLLVLLAVLAMVVAACSSEGGDTTTTADAGGETTTSAGPTPTTGGTDTTAGETPEAPESITIGAVVPITGPFAGGGAQVERGYRYAVEAINEAGGVFVEEYGVALPLELDLRDDASDPNQTTALMQELGGEDIVAYLGGFGSPVHAAATAVAEQNEIAYLGVATALQALHEQGYRYFFSPFPKSPDIAVSVFELLDTHPGGRAAVPGGHHRRGDGLG